MEVKFNSRVCLIPPVEHSIRVLLTEHFSYTHRRNIRGKEAWSRFGKSHGTEFSKRTFVVIEKDGSICLPAGFIDKAVAFLNSLGIPAVPVPVGFNDVTPDWARLKSKVQFRESQEETIQKLISVYHGGVEAAPGYGKGFVIWCLTELFPDSTFDIVADSVVVCRNLLDYLQPYIPDVGMIGGGKRKKGSRVNVYVLDSLHHSDGKADFLIVDEVHTAVSEKAASKFAIYKNARRFWFSASPEGRGDNADMRVEAMFGPSVIQIPYQECVRMGLVVNLHIKWIDIDLPFNPIENISDPYTRAKLGIWRNTPRNEILATDINSIHPDEQTLVLVSKVEHLCNLYPMLHGFRLAFGDNENSIAEARQWSQLGLLSPDNLEDRGKKNEAMRKDFAKGELKKVIVTSIWDTGANFPKLTQIARTDPFDSGIIKDKQAPGRGSRIDGDWKTSATIRDTVDRFDPGLYYKSLGRRSRYSSQGWEESGWVSRG